MMAAESLRAGLVAATELAILAIDAMALALVLAGSVRAFAAGLPMLFAREAGGEARRAVWLRYARVLVAALTFQLAADIIETAITADWQTVARLGAIAAIRTFLNHFLERDLAEIRDRRRPDGAGPAPLGGD